MAYKYVVHTEIMDAKNFLNEVEVVITVLKKNAIEQVDMLYGWSWGDWKPFKIGVSDIVSHIKKQEYTTQKGFVGNDVYLVLTNPEIEVLFCHEEDIHISFSEANKITDDIIDGWKGKRLMHSVKENDEDIPWENHNKSD
ncbi:MAG: hypothetical protein P4L41_03005 [Flavipsychrobacter sp.]|nr:hypothetical protein [Flavipsychrobacter sp.]